MISVAIVEDDVKDTDLLQECLNEYSEKTGELLQIARFSSGLLFLDGYSPKYDVVFIDIEMPEMDGMVTARELRKYDEKIYIIFLTNMVKYAIQGYEVNALDYFLKPVRYDDLRIRMERIRREKRYDDVHFTVPFRGGVKRVHLRDVLYIESLGHNITLHTVGGNYEYRGPSMKKLEEELEKYGFFRCNTCYIINLKYCSSVEGFTVTVGDEKLQISRPRKKDFMNALLKSFTI